MDKILLTTDELNHLKNLQVEYNQIIIEMGEVEVQLQNLSNQKSQIIKKLQQHQDKQNSIGVELNNKYGPGSINLETGEFNKI